MKLDSDSRGMTGQDTLPLGYHEVVSPYYSCFLPSLESAFLNIFPKFTCILYFLTKTNSAHTYEAFFPDPYLPEYSWYKLPN